jgi:hypothetical protein
LPDLLLGERGEARELAGVLDDLDDHLAGWHLPEILDQRGALRLQRLEQVGSEDLLLARRMAHHEVGALDAHVAAGDFAGVPGHGEPVAPDAGGGGPLEQRHRLVVALLLEPEHPLRQGQRRVGRRGAREGEERLPGAVHVLVGEQLDGGARSGPRVGPGRRRRRCGEGEREEEGRADHLTSSS